MTGAPSALVVLATSLETSRAVLEQLGTGAGACVLALPQLSHPATRPAALALARSSRLRVAATANGAVLAADTLYVAGEGQELTVRGGRLAVRAVERPHREQLKELLRSLPRHGSPAFVLLSPGPHSRDAIVALEHAGATLLPIASPAAAPAAVQRLLDAVYRRASEAWLHASAALDPLGSLPSGEIERSLHELGRAVGVDPGFQHPELVVPRIAARMRERDCASLAAYLEHLEACPQEADRVRQLLSATASRFLDPDALAALSAALDDLFARSAGADELRAWVPGCGTGEGIYSVAIALCEAVRRSQSPRAAQLFGTDGDGAALRMARRARYPHAAARALGRDVVERYFTETERHMQVRMQLRRSCVFARHDVLSDPPFLRLGLVSCRDLIHQLAPADREAVVCKLHHTLAPGGLLLAGSPEHVELPDGLFEPVSPKQGLFRARARVRSRVQTPVEPLRAASMPETHADLRIAELQRALAEERARLAAVEKERQQFNRALLASQDELESVNRKLELANAELGDKVRALDRAHAQLDSFFQGTQVAALVLDPSLAIAALSHPARDAFDLDDRHLGQPFEAVAARIAPEAAPALARRAREVQRRLAPREIRIEPVGEQGKVYLVRILPYRGHERTLDGVVVVFLDVTALERAERRTRTREQQQAAVARLGMRALGDAGIDHLFEQALAALKLTMGTQSACLFELTSQGKQLQLRSHFGFDPAHLGDARVPAAGARSHAGLTLTIGQAVIVTDLASETRFEPSRLLVDQGVASGIACPVHDDEGTFGVLAAYSHAPRDFSSDDANFVQAVANVLTATLSRHRDRRRLMVEHAASRVLAESSDLDQLTRRLLTALMPVLGTVASELWLLDEDEEGLRRKRLLLAYELEAEGQDVLVTRWLDRFRVGAQLAEQVLDNGKPRWLDDLAGPLACGFAVPLRLEGRSRGALTFFSSMRQLPPSEPMLRSLARIARSIGEFVKKRRIEHALRESERRFRLLGDSAPVLIWMAGRDGRTTWVNKEWLEVTGRSLEQALEGGWADDIHPDDRERRLAAQADAARGRVAFELEYRLRARDGSYRWVVDRGAPRFAEDGSFAGLIGSAIDITERKQMQVRLEESERRHREQSAELESIYSSLPVGVSIHDRDLRFVRVNQRLADLYGLSPEEPLGRPAAEVLPELESTAATMIHRVFETGEPIRDVELSTRPEQGERRALLCSYAPVKDAAGTVAAVSSVVLDISDRKRAEDALREADRQKDEFLAMLGHELRNPLAAIRNATQLLELIKADDPELARIQQVLERQTAHTARLIDGLLDVSRIVRGKMRLERQTLELSELIRHVAEDRSASIERGRLTLVLELPRQPIWIAADRVRIVQVVDNLVCNAIKFTPPGGELRIAVHPEGKRVRVEVSDTGAGIAPELLPHIFEPFRQARQTLDRSQGGLGLGLALVQGLVRLHRGTIRAESKGPGEGSTFIVELPLVSAPAERPSDPPPAPPSMRVLVIEDNQDMALMMRCLLERAGHRVSVAGSGAEAMSLAQGEPPDAVLCDIGLPGDMNGYDIARAMRANPKTSRVALVAVTGYGRSELQAKQAGFDATFTKPVDFKQIQQMLSRLARAR